MNNFSGSNVTNSLLAIIAVLMLVSVIQNSASKTPYAFPSAPMQTTSGANPGMNPHGSMGHNHSASEDSAPQEEFNLSAMIFAALKCPNDGTLTLGEPGCQGAEATKRRQTVEESISQGQAPRAIFDTVIQKFGEKALTEQALEIRRARRG